MKRHSCKRVLAAGLIQKIKRMENTKAVFKPNRLIYILIFAHLIPYACWAFIDLSLINPLLITFNSSEGRGGYLCFLFCILFMSCPFILPFEEQK